MKGTIFVSIFMAIMVLVGSVMTPVSNNNDLPEEEIAIVEVENF